MQYLSAYTLASLSGKQPGENELIAILKATGKDFDEAEVKKVVQSLKGKSLHELISKGQSKVGSAKKSQAAPEPAKKEDKKIEEKKQAPPPPPPMEEEENDDFNLDLFG